MLGALISPWAVPLGLPFLWYLYIAATRGFVGASLQEIIEFVALYLVLGLPLTYAVTLALVLPMALWLRRRWALSAARLCFWCTPLGPVTLPGYLWLIGGRTQSMFELDRVLLASACGLASGIVFCLVSGIRLLAR